MTEINYQATSYNTSGNKHNLGGTPFRGNYAGIGMIYDEDNDIFIGKKPFASWTLNVAEARWQSPIGDAPALTEEQANNMQRYNWNEANQSWDLTDPSA